MLVLWCRLVGPYLTLSSQYCFVIENLEGIVCGYVLAALDARAFYKQMEMAWIPMMREKYPISKSTGVSTPAQVGFRFTSMVTCTLTHCFLETPGGVCK